MAWHTTPLREALSRPQSERLVVSVAMCGSSVAIHHALRRQAALAPGVARRGFNDAVTWLPEVEKLSQAQ